MQFLAAGEALKRLEKLEPGLLTTNYPDAACSWPSVA